MSQSQRHKVRITSGPHAGCVGVVIDRDPKWVLVRLSEPGWPFPRTEWIHRRSYEVVDALADLPEALV